MPNVRTTVLLGDDMLNGGPPNSRAPTEGAASQFVGGLHGIYANLPLLAQSVPSDPSTGLPPVSPAYTPYWDGRIVATTVTSTSATSTTFTVAPSPGWPVNKWKDRKAVVTAGVGNGQEKRILSNTADTVTIVGTFATPPTASTIQIRGAFVVYHHTNSRSPNMIVPVVPGASGDNWYESPDNGSLGGGLTVNGLYIQMMKLKYGVSAPYFKVFKQAFPGGVGTGGSPLISTGWTQFEAEFAGCNSAAAADGDTLVVDHVYVDAISTDLQNGNLNLQTHLDTLIGLIRAKFGTDCLITLVNHHLDFLKTSIPLEIRVAARNIVADAARVNTNVRVLDMNWARFGSTAPLGSPVVPADPKQYVTEDIVQSGARLFNLYEAWQLAAGSPTPGRATRVVAMVTDSQGKTINPMRMFHGDQESILGPTGGTVREHVWIYDKRTKSIERLDPMANACTVPTLSATPFTIGLEQTMTKKLFDELCMPDAAEPADLILFKSSKDGVAVTTEADAAGATGALEEGASDYPTLVADWNDFHEACQSAGFVPDLLDLVLVLTDNDDPTVAAAQALAAKLPTFIDQMRAVFSTRTTELHVTIVQPPAHITAENGQSVHGNAAARQIVRDAVAALSTKSGVTVIPSNKKRYELIRGDRIHYGGEAQDNLGYDVADAILAALVAASASGAGGGSATEPCADSAAVDASPGAGAAAIAGAINRQPDIAGYSVSSDGHSVQRRSLKDMIEADQYLEGKAARDSGYTHTLADFNP